MNCRVSIKTLPMTLAILLCSAVSCQDEKKTGEVPADDGERPLSFVEAELKIAQYQECGLSHGPCATEGETCYGMRDRRVCLPDDATACRLFGCANDVCTMEGHRLDDDDDVWTAHEVTTCLAEIPLGKDAFCAVHADKILPFEECEIDNVLVQVFGCNLCLSRQQACKMYDCPTSSCEVLEITVNNCGDEPWEECPEPKTIDRHIVYSCLEKYPPTIWE